jgi:DNA-binding MarR family transcriptional regulator
LSLAHALGLDKTTLTSLLDRMENRGFITRCLDTHDRRARIPVLTDAGRSVQCKVAAARDHAEAMALRGFTAAEQELLRDLLARLATDQPGNSSHGSCI